MIPSLIIVGLAFTWLLYESDWMRVRLLVGPITQPVPIKTIKLHHVTDPSVTYIKHGLTRRDSGRYDKHDGDMLLAVGIEEPITGWDWILNHDHPLVEYSFELIAWGCKHALTLNPDAHKGQIVKECCKIAFAKPRNGNGRKPKHSKGLTFNPYYTLTRPKRRKSSKRR